MHSNRVVCGKGAIDNAKSLHDALLLEEYGYINDGVLLRLILFNHTSCIIYQAC